MAVKPITPQEATEKKLSSIPDLVIEVFNQLLSETPIDYITIKQDEIVRRLVERGLDRQEIFDNHWLDVEDIYRKAGWKVYYENPGYNESFDPYFSFTKPKAKY